MLHPSVRNDSITIYVEQEHITNGVMCSPGNCPVSLALTKYLGVGASVGTDKCSFGPKNDIDYQLPKEVEYFIANFDSDKQVEPFSFVLDFSKRL